MANASRPFFNANVDESPVIVVGSFAQKLHSYVVHNAHATNTTWLQVFDITNPTVGTTVPVLSIPLPPGVSGGLFGDLVIATKGAANAGVSIAVTATSTGNGAPGAVQQVNLTYS